MEVRIKHSQINGKLTANPSKSSMQRAIAVSLLANGTSLIQNSSQSNDCKAALKIAEQLGATILQKDNQIEITSSQLVASTNTINCGESGLAIRMFTPIISLLSQEFTITGSGSLLKRPIGFLEEILPQLEVKCKTNQGLPPQN